jgi:glycosyltransferase 2 family protein
MPLKKIIKFSLSLTIGFVFIWLSLQGIDWQETLSAISKVSPFTIIICLLIISISFCIRWARWFLILKKYQKQLDYKLCFSPLVICWAINSVIPAKAGELVRVYMMSKRSKISKTQVLSSAIIERIFDGLLLLSLFFMAIKMVSLPYWVHHVLNLFGIVFIIAVVTLYAFTLSKPLHGYLNNNNWRFGAGLGRLAGKLLEALAIINNFKTILILASLSLIPWLVEAWTYCFLMNSFGFNLNFTDAIVIISMVNFGILVLQAPGGIGPFEYIIIKSLSLFSISHSSAMAFAIVVHSCIYLPSVILGGYLMMKTGFNWQSIKKEEI